MIKKILCLWLLAVAMMLGCYMIVHAQNDPYQNLRDQVITDSERLKSLEREMLESERTGTNFSRIQESKILVLEARLNSMEMEIISLDHQFYAVITFVMINVIGVAVFGARYYIENHPEHDHDNKDEEDD